MNRKNVSQRFYTLILPSLHLRKGGRAPWTLHLWLHRNTDATEVSITVKVPNKTLLSVLSAIALVVGLIL